MLITVTILGFPTSFLLNLKFCDTFFRAFKEEGSPSIKTAMHKLIFYANVAKYVNAVMVQKQAKILYFHSSQRESDISYFVLLLAYLSDLNMPHI